MSRGIAYLVVITLGLTAGIGCLPGDSILFGDDGHDAEPQPSESGAPAPLPAADGPTRTPQPSDLEPNLPETALSYGVDLPDHYLQGSQPLGSLPLVPALAFDNTPDWNPTTDEGATLGRVLFYDKSLSANGTTACASCHFQEIGFADNERQSLGFDGRRTRRHSMGLANARFYGSGKFFWDERAETLEEQVLMPFQDPVEMGLSLDELLELVESKPYYEPLFAEAFGDGEVTQERTARALAQFIRSMASVDSRYDRARIGMRDPLVDFPEFSESENRGKRLFFDPPRGFSCSGCHASEAFVGVVPGGDRESGATNNGLDARSTDDLGLAETTDSRRDEGRFKAPSLRNVAVSAPYMHDGRFKDLDAVLAHYSSGIEAHPNLQEVLEPGGRPVRYQFDERDRQDLIAFLETLTDEELLTAERFSDPFPR